MSEVWHYTRSRGSGILNMGNSCFVNAAMQLLMRVQPLYLMLGVHHEQHQRSDPEVDCLLCALYRQWSHMRDGELIRASATTRAARRGIFGRDFQASVHSQTPQCDTWDFMCSLLEKVDGDEARLRADTWQNRGVLREYILGILFRERSSCTQCCGTCDFLRVRMAIDLNVEEGDHTLQQLFERHCGQQRGQGQKCPLRDTTLCEGEAFKQEYMEREPPVLLMRFLRFYQHPVTLAERRRNVHIDLPQCIDFFRSGPYQFAGAVLHHGDTTAAGHYTALCLESVSSHEQQYRWYDDARCGEPVTWQQCVNQKFAGSPLSLAVYVVVYVRTQFWSEATGDGTEATPYLRDSGSVELSQHSFRGRAAD